MDDLESRLRTEVARRTEEFSPSGDVLERIHGRVRQRHRRRQVLAGVMVGAAASLLAVVMAVGNPLPSQHRVETGDDGPDRTEDTTTTPSTSTEGTSTTTSPPEDTTTSSTTTSSTSTTTSVPPQEVVTFNDFTPLSRRGIGPIRVGMGVAEAEAAADVTIEVAAPLTADATCTQAQVSGTNIRFELELPGTPGADPREVGVIRSVDGRYTEEGVTQGAPRAVLDEVYGAPTRSFPHPLGIGEIVMYESGGYAYAFTIIDGRVAYLLSGDPTWIEVPEGCQ